ncbi:ectonucleotide pyrophosphatase/phosphodiesterase family member 7-like [Clavelina lepadiformis]|uniref:ectonucleotide pyrophosphatase/phosphodiesterase family member 7-like n=1 Tax=Clavelina lepadiformis TaxID=159417 RepID=UPI004042D281
MKICIILLTLQIMITTNILLVSTSTVKTGSGAGHKLLLVSFDGFRWDYSQRTPDLEAFKYLRENGVVAEYMKPVFPSQTSPNHFSIATGLYTESHGVVHNCNYNISDGPPISSFYSALAVNEWWDNGGEPIWITAVNQGLRSGGYLFPGSFANISGVSATKKILETFATPSEESDWMKRIDETMEWFTKDGLDMIALYFEQPDVESHDKGPDSEVIAEIMMPLLNRTILYLLKKVEEYNLIDDLNIIITSDHGFTAIDTSVKGEDAISIARYVNQSYVDFQFSYGPLGLVEPIPGTAKYVKNKLQEGNQNMKVYLKEELPERFHYKNNDRITSIVILAEPGYDVYPIFPLFHINAGDHGYDNDLQDMRTSYFSIGPSFKKNYTVAGFENVHIYPLMCHLLGLAPAPNNGSLDVLLPTLRSKSGGNVCSNLFIVFASTLIGIVSRSI